MARIAVIGGTGYAGRNIVAEAAERGHQVLAVSRSLPAERTPHVSYVECDVLDLDDVVHAVSGVDAVVIALSPRGTMAGAVRPAVAALVRALPDGVRVGVVGGAGASLVSPGGPRLLDGDFAAEYRPEAEEMAGVLDDLRATGSAHDWFLVHPAGNFGPWAPGERTGTYRDGGDVIVTDENGDSNISGADLGVAVVDELETPKHVGERFTVGY